MKIFFSISLTETMQSFFGNDEGSLTTDDPISYLRPDLNIQQVKLSSQRLSSTQFGLLDHERLTRF